FFKKSPVSDLRHTQFHIFMLVFIFSLAGATLSTHLALCWVFLEATTLSSAYLIYFERTSSSLEAAWKYMFICSIGIALAFVGIILLSIGHASGHSLFFKDLYHQAAEMDIFWLKLSFTFILIGLGTKMGLAPVHAWLPDAHSESPSPVSALLSGTLLNTALLGIIRFNHLLRIAGIENWGRVLLYLMGFLSLLISAAYILTSRHYKRMLAYSSIENMGIIAICLATGPTALWALMLQIVSHSMAKASLFLTSGTLYLHYKSKEIEGVHGICRRLPATGWIWILSFLALAGIPPSPIFYSEFQLVKALFQNEHIGMAILFLFTLTVILYGMGRNILAMAGGGSSATDRPESGSWTSILPQIILLTGLLILGLLMPDRINTILQQAADYPGGQP
ncbi:MAG: hypothetical protein KBA26_15390, partial [Candidatus Delongbacteria bacterium]|nr:hypothetical protein [Candidatus Delongbacteria bacterium]